MRKKGSQFMQEPQNLKAEAYTLRAPVDRAPNRRKTSWVPEAEFEAEFSRKNKFANKYITGMYTIDQGFILLMRLR
jgi:hypothetical protein